MADVLPKHWGGPAGGGEVAEQLEGKQVGHNGLLRALGDAGVLAQLEPLALRCACMHQFPSAWLVPLTAP